MIQEVVCSADTRQASTDDNNLLHVCMSTFMSR
jgi:hypothetical protein